MNKNTNIDNLLKNSYFKILIEKNKLNKLYNIIFNFCSQNNVIISNYNINLSKINKIKYKLYDINKDFEFNLYSTNPYKDAINLANIIYKEYTKFIVLTSYLNNKEIIITVNNDKIIKFNLLFLFSNTIMSKLILPSTNISYMKSNNTKLLNKITYKLYYSSDLIELLDICYKLYKPNYFLSFLKNNDINNNSNEYSIEGYNINYVYNTLVNNIIKEDNITNIDNLFINDKIYELRSNINSYILKSINEDNYTDIKMFILDKQALQLIYNMYTINNFNLNLEKINSNDIIHLIIQTKYITMLINIIEEYLNSNNLKHIYKIGKKNSNYHIINDFRLTRTTIDITNVQTKKKTILLYSYNTIDYDIIPSVYKINNILIPHPIVIIRFLLINLFNMQLFDPNYNNNSVSINLITIAHKLINNIHLDVVNNKLTISYYGNYIDERIEKFKLGSNIYKPWQYELKNNKLLII